MAKKKPNDYGAGRPLHEAEALARVLLPKIQKFVESKEGQRELQVWQERQKRIIIYGGTSKLDAPPLAVHRI